MLRIAHFSSRLHSRCFAQVCGGWTDPLAVRVHSIAVYRHFRDRRQRVRETDRLCRRQAMNPGVELHGAAEAYGALGAGHAPRERQRRGAAMRLPDRVPTPALEAVPRISSRVSHDNT